SWARRCSPPASSSICPISAAPRSCASSTCRCAPSSASRGTEAAAHFDDRLVPLLAMRSPRARLGIARRRAEVDRRPLRQERLLGGLRLPPRTPRGGALLRRLPFPPRPRPPP